MFINIIGKNVHTNNRLSVNPLNAPLLRVQLNIQLKCIQYVAGGSCSRVLGLKNVEDKTLLQKAPVFHI